VRGVSLGTAGVLLAALAFGIFASFVPYLTIGTRHIVFYLETPVTLEGGAVLGATKGLFSLVSNVGTSMFVTAIGLIAGPKFFRTFRRKSLCYIIMGFAIIALGALATVLILMLSRDANMDASLAVGLMTGALTSTPGLSAATELAADEAKALAGYGIGYLFGVIGVVLFVQLVPKLLKLDIAAERERFVAATAIDIAPPGKKLLAIDSRGYFPFMLVVVFGSMIGCVRIPGVNFSLGASGGMLLAGLILGHFGRIGPIDCRVGSDTLHVFQELGLVLFLIGAGVPGGVRFIANVRLSYFIYGMIITLVPMAAGYFIGKSVFRLSVFNNLGAITGGMTSTPALGALIATTGTSEVANAYAATYPFALFAVVLASRIIVSVL
jgi:putative transport protein